MTETKSTTFEINNLQGQVITFKGKGESGGLRDLPLSRRPIPLGSMASASSNLPITFTMGANSILEFAGGVNEGNKAMLVFKKNFTGFDPGVNKVTITITASRGGTNTLNAASSVTQSFDIVKPSSTAFFSERRLDPRYEAVRAKFVRKMLSKSTLKGLIDLDGSGSIDANDAKLLFDSDDYDSDGDGMSNFLERAFGGDSLSNDLRAAKPRPIMKKDGKQRLSFLKYTDSSNDEGIEYIIERSTDMRTWLQYDNNTNGSAISNGIRQVDISGDVIK